MMRVPERIIEINGALLRADISNDVQDVTIDDGPDQSDHFQITVNNHHGRWTDLELFDEGNSITIRLGYVGGPYLNFEGKIMAPGGKWPESGNPTLIVEGYDLGYSLGRSKKTRAWANVRDSDIAKKIAEEAGLQAVVEKTPVLYPQLMQEDISDLGFLFKRAKKWDFDVWMEGRTLHFARRTSNQPTVHLRWGENIRSISRLRKSVADVATMVVAKGWDPILKQTVTGKADSDTAGDKLEVVGAKITVQVLGEVQSFVSRQIPSSQQEAQELAEAKFSHLAKGYVEGELTVEGNPELRRGTVFSLEGVGRRFNGVYTVTNSRHSHGSGGYITTISFTNQRQVKENG